MNKLAKGLLHFYSLFVKKSNDYLLFESANDFYDNSYVLYKYIKEHYPQYKLKYLITSKEMKAKGPSQGVSKKEMIHVKNKLKLYKYSLKAKCVFFSYLNYWKKLKLQESTKVVYLNHGEFPIKDCTDYYNYLFSNPQENKIDVVMGTEHINKTLTERYPVLKEQPHVIVGAPRNDEMFSSKIDKESFLANLGVSNGKEKQIILSMTTFRNKEVQSIEYFKEEFPLKLDEKDLEKLDKKLGNNKQVLIIKLHHAQSGVKVPEGLQNICFLNNKKLSELKVTINLLYSISDSLITDYSSAYLSYLNLDRPVAFLLTDFQNYNQNQGFTVENIESIMPGDKMYSLEELCTYFDNLHNGVDKYKNQRKEICSLYSGNYQNQNCKSVTDHYLK